MKDRAPIHWELYLGLPCGFRDWSKSYFAAFPGTLAGTLVGSGAGGTPIGTQKACWCFKRWFKLICSNTSPNTQCLVT